MFFKKRYVVSYSSWQIRTGIVEDQQSQFCDLVNRLEKIRLRTPVQFIVFLMEGRKH